MKIRARVFVHRRVVVHHDELFEIVPFADLVIVRIVRRSDLYRARSEFRFDIFVGDDRNFAVGQRQKNRFTDQICVAFVFRINRNRRVAEHRFRARRRHRDFFVRIFDRIMQKIKFAVFFRFLFYFEIGQNGFVFRTPVDNSQTAIDIAFVIQSDKNIRDGFRQDFLPS